jgi:hypothetical protein
MRVMFEYLRLGAAYLFVRDLTSGRWSVVEVAFDKIKVSLNAETVYVVHGREPTHYHGVPTLLIASCYSVYKDFVKTDRVRCTTFAVAFAMNVCVCC